MSYKILDRDSVAEYLLKIEPIKRYFSGSNLSVAEIGDGNLNYVFIVTDGKQNTLIVKQAVPYLRCAGEEYQLSRERMNYEIRALREYGRFSADLVPKIYHSDEAMSLVVMEYLQGCKILRRGLFEQNIYPNLTDHLSTFLATTLFKTSSLALSSSQKRQMMDAFNSNVDLCKLSEDFIFTTAFMDHETNSIQSHMHSRAEELFNDMEFKSRVLELKYIFMTHSDALLHGDLHTGSIMVDNKRTYIIDPEFAFFGPFGFDVGALVANLINIYISSIVRGVDERYKEYLLRSIESIYVEFEEKFLALWEIEEQGALIERGFLDRSSLTQYKNRFMQDIFSQSVGFAGVKIARRVFGIAGVEEIRGLPADQRVVAEELALKIARKLVVLPIKSLPELMQILRGSFES